MVIVILFGFFTFTHVPTHCTAHVELPASLLAPPTNPNPAASSSATPPPALPKDTKEKKKKHHLTAGNDPLFRELRDLNFAHVGRKLSKVAKRLEEDYKVWC